jgi:DNA gyrase subunit B/topoisomerase-4 subunit B
VHEAAFAVAREHDETGLKLDLVMQWTESTDEHVRSYVNGIPTGSGGTHENGLRGGLGKAIRNFIETHNLSPKGVTLTAEDIREGMHGVLSVFLKEPQFQGQTKDRLNNPEVTAIVDSMVRPALEHWLNHTKTTAEAIVARIILAARAREASRAAQAEVTRKSATSSRLTLPGKLSDCTSPGREESEIFIVEGDSAGGSAKQGRDRAFQAILPLRGKVLNSEQASTAKVLTNKELADIVSALGCGTGKGFDAGKLRYHKICLLMDADSDGNHICTLLLTFFYRHLPELIRGGYVYIAQPPLYRIEAGKSVQWARDDAERDRILAGLNGGRSSVAVQRFKGLGEMNPSTLKETTLDPARRALLRVAIGDEDATERAIQTLMGRDVAPRFEFIMERAPRVDDIDI